MLIPPSRGFARSVNTHNVDVDAMAEWIEGSVTFVEDSFSQVDIVDVLVEQSLYQDQDFAKERIADVWAELDRRRSILKDACPFEFRGNRIMRICEWTTSPAYSFCLMSALQVSYRRHFSGLSKQGYAKQGELFERLTHESMNARGWSVYSTGWSKSATNSLRQKVSDLAGHLGEGFHADTFERWTDSHAKDGGLDVVCYFHSRTVGAGAQSCFCSAQVAKTGKTNVTPRTSHFGRSCSILPTNQPKVSRFHSHSTQMCFAAVRAMRGPPFS